MDILSYILGKKAGGGGGEAVLINKSISANGTYNASSDSADGYKKVEVSVPASAVDTGTKSITSNGNGQDVVGYASVDVDVPNSYSVGDEGKVVSDGALVSQGSDTVTSNGMVDTTLISSLTVNVGGLSLEKVLGKNFATDEEIDITVPDSGLAASVQRGWYKGLFARTPIKSLTIRGLLICPPELVSASGGNDSVKRLTSASLPDAVYGGNDAFRDQKNLVSVDLPSLSIGYENYTKYTTNMFNGCSALTNLNIRNLTYVCDSTVRACTSLQILEFNSVTNIETNAFLGSSKLATMIIRSGSVPTLGAIAAFQGTPFASGGTGGTLYVPSALISSYQGASNWSTILGYANNQIKAIEGSYYETHHSDGTVIS